MEFGIDLEYENIIVNNELINKALIGCYWFDDLHR